MQWCDGIEAGEYEQFLRNVLDGIAYTDRRVPGEGLRWKPDAEIACQVVEGELRSRSFVVSQMPVAPVAAAFGAEQETSASTVDEAPKQESSAVVAVAAAVTENAGARLRAKTGTPRHAALLRLTMADGALGQRLSDVSPHRSSSPFGIRQSVKARGMTLLPGMRRGTGVGSAAGARRSVRLTGAAGAGQLRAASSLPVEIAAAIVSAGGKGQQRIAVGTKVSVWQPGWRAEAGQRWADGVVTGASEDGTYDIRYTDESIAGDEQGVEASRIEVLNEPSSPPRVRIMSPPRGSLPVDSAGNGGSSSPAGGMVRFTLGQGVGGPAGSRRTTRRQRPTLRLRPGEGVTLPPSPLRGNSSARKSVKLLRRLTTAVPATQPEAGGLSAGGEESQRALESSKQVAMDAQRAQIAAEEAAADAEATAAAARKLEAMKREKAELAAKAAADAAADAARRAADAKLARRRADELKQRKATKAEEERRRAAAAREEAGQQEAARLSKLRAAANARKREQAAAAARKAAATERIGTANSTVRTGGQRARPSPGVVAGRLHLPSKRHEAAESHNSLDARGVLQEPKSFTGGDWNSGTRANEENAAFLGGPGGARVDAGVPER